jgi:hypothetical protein
MYTVQVRRNANTQKFEYMMRGRGSSSRRGAMPTRGAVGRGGARPGRVAPVQQTTFEQKYAIPDSEKEEEDDEDDEEEEDSQDEDDDEGGDSSDPELSEPMSSVTVEKVCAKEMPHSTHPHMRDSSSYAFTSTLGI